jgi:hypothetical protein
MPGSATARKFTMADKLQRIFEYRVLLARARKRQPDLDAQEQSRLDRLHQQLPLSVPPLDERDPYTLLGQPLAAEFAVDGRFLTGSLRNVSGGGLAIATTDPPALGQLLTIHVQDRPRAMVYSFPARVVSRVVRGVPAMSVAFEGVPIQTRIAKSSGVWIAQEIDATRKRDSA